MNHSIFRTTLAAALLVAPVLSAAQPQEAPKAPAPGSGPMAGHPGMAPGGMGGGMMKPGRMNPMMMKMHQAGGGPGAMAGMRQRRDLKAEIGLTDVQQADLRKAREAGQKDRILKQAAARVARMELQSLLRADKVDEKAVAAKLAEVQAAQGALLKIRVDQALAMKRILTPEQQKKLQSIRGDRGHRMGRASMRGRMNRGGHPGAMGQGRGGGAGRGRMGHPMGQGGVDEPEFDEPSVR